MLEGISARGMGLKGVRVGGRLGHGSPASDSLMEMLPLAP